MKFAIGQIPLKVILEISELKKNEIIKACEICLDTHTDYIKTSSGFSKSGATLTAVNIPRARHHLPQPSRAVTRVQIERLSR